MHWRRQWQPTPVFLPGESQGRGSLVGCRLWGHAAAAAAAAAARQRRHTGSPPPTRPRAVSGRNSRKGREPAYEWFVIGGKETGRRGSKPGFLSTPHWLKDWGPRVLIG